MGDYSIEKFKKCVDQLQARSMGVKYSIIHGGMLYKDLIDETIKGLLKLRKTTDYCIRFLRKQKPK